MTVKSIKTKEKFKNKAKYIIEQNNTISINIQLLVKDYPELAKELVNIVNTNLTNLPIISFIANPTSNCQLNSLQTYSYSGKAATIQALLKTSLKELVNYLFTNLKNTTLVKSYFSSRPLLLLDLKVGIAESYFLPFINEANIKVKAPYTSTNNSHMMILVVKTNNLFK